MAEKVLHSLTFDVASATAERVLSFSKENCLTFRLPFSWEQSQSKSSCSKMFMCIFWGSPWVIILQQLWFWFRCEESARPMGHKNITGFQVLWVLSWIQVRIQIDSSLGPKSCNENADSPEVENGKAKKGKARWSFAARRKIQRNVLVFETRSFFFFSWRCTVSRKTHLQKSLKNGVHLFCFWIFQKEAAHPGSLDWQCWQVPLRKPTLP